MADARDELEPYQEPAERDFSEIYHEKNFDLCAAHYRGYTRAMKDIRYALTTAGRPTSWFDAMMDQLQDDENTHFATQVIGG